jgi:LDH2 family malate/lactate/ureidoglycolate dehydrogenase
MMIAIDIGWFMPVAEFKARMDAFIADIKAAKKRPGVSEILVPGELDYRREREFRKTGALLDAEVFDELAALANDLKIEFPFAREGVA